VSDAAVTGHPLRLGGSTYEKGLGVHSPCRIVYKLDGQYRRFESLVGFDEAIARRGRARLAVLLNGKRVELNEGKELTSHDAPLKVRLDVRNVRSMTLLVELGSFGDVQAKLNWAKARLIKE
jgi:NPCBM/NEW2 domain